VNRLLYPGAATAGPGSFEGYHLLTLTQFICL
jgi:hypothetical protein